MKKLLLPPSILISLLVCLVIGCQQPKEPPLNENAQKMVEVLKDVSKEDCETLYYLFSGIAEYTERYSGVESTSQINSLYSVVKSRFGKKEDWLTIPGDDNDISDVIEKLMNEEGFDKRQKFTDESRAKFVQIFRDGESAANQAFKAKVK